MTTQSAAYGILHPAPPREGSQVAPGLAGQLPTRQCRRCGAVGTHYLTCPGLRLPPGYRLSEDHGPEFGRGLPAGTCGSVMGEDVMTGPGRSRG